MKTFSEEVQDLREHEEQQLDEVAGFLLRGIGWGWNKMPRWMKLTAQTGTAAGSGIIAFDVTMLIRELVLMGKGAAQEMNELTQWVADHPAKATAIFVAAGATVIAAQQAVAELRERRSTRKMVKILTAAGANSAVGKTIDGDKIIEVTPQDERKAEQALLAAN